jgi:tyrosine-specific transport protein
MASNIGRTTPSILGGILLVIGNVVGAGILALPIATAQLGLPLAIAVLFFFWLVMMLGAYYFLEANLALPSGANLASMARAGLGKWGVFVTWICYLIVMYSLIAAYMAGGGDLIKINLQYLGLTIPSSLACFLFLIVFGYIVTRGMHITDHANRILMTTKIILFFATVLGLTAYFKSDIISLTQQKKLSGSLLIIIITSFGFATLIPSLRNYYNSDVRKIKKIILWGTLLPFICYVVWITVVFSVVPYYGNNGLEQMSTSPHPVSDLQTALTASLHIEWITQATNIFSAICIITSFLANSISLSDFIADGLNLQRNKRWLVYLLTYLPPLAAILLYPKAFLMGLSIAGTIAIIQLLILPSLIVWSLRYIKKKPLENAVIGGKVLLLLLLVISFALLLFVILN